MTVFTGTDTAKTRRELKVGDATDAYYSIAAAEEAGLGDFSRLPAALKVVLENMLRFEDGKTVTVDDIKAFSEWGANGGQNPREIAYRPARVLLQDFTGVPAVVDLVAMRDAIIATGEFPLGGTRVRGHCADICVVADGGAHDFLDITFRIGVGRSQATKEAAVEALYAAAEAFLRPTMEKRSFALSLELLEMDGALSLKRFNNIRDHL